MARSNDIFLRPTDLNSANGGAPRQDGYNDVWLAGVKRRTGDLRFGGQMGYNLDFTHWVNAHPYVSRNVIPILIEPPLGMKALPNSKIWIRALKSMVETMPLSITGLNAQLDVSTDSTPFGGGGEEFEVYTDVKRARSDINFTWVEKTGLPIYRYMSAWIRYLMMDPDTKNATINTMPNARLNDLMADQYSMTMLFIEPDELHRFVTQSWLVTNMFPKTTGENTAKREQAAGQSKRELSIGFTGIAQYGAGVDDFAQAILNEISIIGADPHGREAFIKKIDGMVRDITGSGFDSGVRGFGYEASTEINEPLNRILHPETQVLP